MYFNIIISIYRTPDDDYLSQIKSIRISNIFKLYRKFNYRDQ